MSHIHGLRNLKDLYSSRYNEYSNQDSTAAANSSSANSSIPQSAVNTSRIKLPVFSSNS